MKGAIITNIPLAIGELLDVSRQFPDEEIIIRVQNGTVKVGFPKGDYGDQQHALWERCVAKLQYTSES